jgi:hypothetical protein
LRVIILGCAPGLGKDNPLSFIHVNGLCWSHDCAEFNVIDAATQNTFGGVVSSSGSNQYKVRSNGSNYIRVA